MSEINFFCLEFVMPGIGVLKMIFRIPFEYKLFIGIKFLNDSGGYYCGPIIENSMFAVCSKKDESPIGFQTEIMPISFIIMNCFEGIELHAKIFLTLDSIALLCRFIEIGIEPVLYFEIQRSDRIRSKRKNGITV